MTVEPFVPDIAPGVVAAPVAAPLSQAFASALDAAGASLDRAERAEDQFAGGNGSLQDAVLERARADVALSIATAVAQRGAQAIQSILNMQV